MINQEIIQRTLECIYTVKVSADELYKSLECKRIKDFRCISNDLRNFLLMIQQINNKHTLENPEIKLSDAIESVIASLEQIYKYSGRNIPLALHKIEFELIPFIDSMYAEYYFWTCIFPHREKWEDYYKNEMPELYANKYIEKSIDEGKYKYDLSILVVGYNKLEYTQTCVNSVLAHLPEDVTCELILVNHGSTDETKSFFDTIKPTKQMDIKVNSSLNLAYTRIIEGEFYLAVSNDTIILHNAINNMLRAIIEDDTIGRVVPTTPNVSNLQTIKADFNDYDGLVKWAEKNNVYDIFRHETRTRLCDPISLTRSNVLLSKNGINMLGRYYTSADFQTFSFPDDEISMLLRRAELKSVLCKDAYCYHFGSVTINELTEQQKIDNAVAYTNGRIEFAKAFGIDPWGTGYCYDNNLFSAFECKFDGHVEVLGINCGMGSNSLKIKEIYKEKNHNLDVYLTNAVNEEIMVNETNAVSDETYLIKEIEKIEDIGNKKYHYIVLEDPFEESGHRLSDIDLLYDYLIDNGELYVKSNNDAEIDKYKTIDRIAGWLKFTK